ncbi:right-handed parallel beta-helix repeat-containing protein [Allohahella sp. A8]|uniref:right-handed parallel beta-helix repeat-containing protein n=1 Tax=Allohahella sp. A8 TaxID=3141461 RepID=UPI003A801372
MCRWTGLAILASALMLFTQSAVAYEAKHCDQTLTPADDLVTALARLPESGSHQTLCLSEGTFKLDCMLEIRRSGLTLRGKGSASTVLQMKQGVSSPVVVVGDARHQEPAFRVANVQIEALAIRGSQKSAQEFYPPLPYLSNSALIIRGGEDIDLEKLDVRHCRSACVLTEYDSRKVSLTDSHISDAQWDGISLNRAGPTIISGNTIRNNVAAGITVEYMTSSLISNNVIAGNGSHGLYLADAEHNEFRSNDIHGNHLAGVFITCSIRHHDEVMCWDDSFSRDNTFVDNEFTQNRFGYQVAVDKAANCLDWARPRNISRSDTFVASPNKEPRWEDFGRCLAFDAGES